MQYPHSFKYGEKTGQSPQGFTLLEILLVVAAIAILAGIVIVAINPAKQLAETRNAQRRSDVEAIASGLVQYYIRTGAYPSTLASDSGGTCSGKSTDGAFAVCAQGSSCSGGYILEAALVPDYLAAIPTDPASASTYSGYIAFRLDSQRVRVCAPLAEVDASISVTR